MRRKSCLDLAKRLMSPPSTNKQAQVAKEDQAKKEVSFFLVEKDEDDRSLRRIFKQIRKMPQDELELLLSYEDNALIDSMLKDVQKVSKLAQERDELRKKVENLANFNYAREPEFVRDRSKLRATLDEVADVKRRITSKAQNARPILDELDKVQAQLSTRARALEEESEVLAQDFLHGQQKSESDYQNFIDNYLIIRKKTSEHRILADRFSRENYFKRQIFKTLRRFHKK